MKDIYTVIIESQGELSTASFLSFDDAVYYAAQELTEGMQTDFEELIPELEEQMFLKYGGKTVWIEEAQLISSLDRLD